MDGHSDDAWVALWWWGFAGLRIVPLVLDVRSAYARQPCANRRWARSPRAGSGVDGSQIIAPGAVRNGSHLDGSTAPTTSPRPELLWWSRRPRRFPVRRVVPSLLQQSWVQCSRCGARCRVAFSRAAQCATPAVLAQPRHARVYVSRDVSAPSAVRPRERGDPSAHDVDRCRSARSPAPPSHHDTSSASAHGVHPITKQRTGVSSTRFAFTSTLGITRFFARVASGAWQPGL